MPRTWQAEWMNRADFFEFFGFRSGCFRTKTLSRDGCAFRSTEEEAVAFAGCEIARTALGMAYERSLRIEDCRCEDIQVLELVSGL